MGKKATPIDKAPIEKTKVAEVKLKSTPRGTPRGGTPREGTPARDMVQLKPVLKGYTQTQTKNNTDLLKGVLKDQHSSNKTEDFTTERKDESVEPHTPETGITKHGIKEDSNTGDQQKVKKKSKKTKSKMAKIQTPEMPADNNQVEQEQATGKNTVDK